MSNSSASSAAPSNSFNMNLLINIINSSNYINFKSNYDWAAAKANTTTGAVIEWQAGRKTD
jgi:hypothetical protein